MKKDDTLSGCVIFVLLYLLIGFLVYLAIYSYSGDRGFAIVTGLFWPIELVEVLARSAVSRLP